MAGSIKSETGQGQAPTIDLPPSIKRLSPDLQHWLRRISAIDEERINGLLSVERLNRQLPQLHGVSQVFFDNTRRFKRDSDVSWSDAFKESLGMLSRIEGKDITDEDAELHEELVGYGMPKENLLNIVLVVNREKEDVLRHPIFPETELYAMGALDVGIREIDLGVGEGFEEALLIRFPVSTRGRTEDAVLYHIDGKGGDEKVEWIVGHQKPFTEMRPLHPQRQIRA